MITLYDCEHMADWIIGLEIAIEDGEQVVPMQPLAVEIATGGFPVRFNLHGCGFTLDRIDAGVAYYLPCGPVAEIANGDYGCDLHRDALRDSIDLRSVDNGIGPYEFWGQRCNDSQPGVEPEGGIVVDPEWLEFKSSVTVSDSEGEFDEEVDCTLVAYEWRKGKPQAVFDLN